MIQENSGIVREVSSCRVCGCTDLSIYPDLGMTVFDVQKQDILGGTIRVFIGNEGKHDVLPSDGEV